MLGKQATLILGCATLSFATAEAGQFDPPNPEAFVRVQDRERARLVGKPCAEADLGRGCYRFDGRALREAPCTYHIDARTIGSLPTDQCYKMEAPRRFRGVWVDAFEGQVFIPEETTAPDWPRADPQSLGWREKFEEARAATIWLDVSRVNLGHKYLEGGRKLFIEFVGRSTMYPGNYGHMGMSGSEIIVDRVISHKELN